MRRYLPLLIFLLTGCNETIFTTAVGSHLAAPISVAVDPAGLRAYVVNSNSNAEFTGTTLSILNLTNPAAPALLSSGVNPVSIPDFSGQIYFDPATKFAYVPNRLSDNDSDKADAILRINLDESSASFGAVASFANGDNPFGIACCDASGRFYIPASGGTLNVFNPADLTTPVQVSLSINLGADGQFSGTNSTESVLVGTQAFVTNRGGVLYVINTGEVGDTSKNPIDYAVKSTADLRGIATDGTNLYLVDGTAGSALLRIINPATLAPVSPDASSPAVVDMAAVQTRSVSVGNNPNEVAVLKGKAYVSNMGDNTVSVIDIASAAVTATIPVGKQPFGLNAFTIGATDYLYVTNLVSNSISVVDLGTNAVVSTFAP